MVHVLKGAVPITITLTSHVASLAAGCHMGGASPHVGGGATLTNFDCSTPEALQPLPEIVQAALQDRKSVV